LEKGSKKRALGGRGGVYREDGFWCVGEWEYQMTRGSRESNLEKEERGSK